MKKTSCYSPLITFLFDDKDLTPLGLSVVLAVSSSRYKLMYLPVEPGLENSISHCNFLISSRSGVNRPLPMKT